jgi:hypothetical protein
MNRLILAGLASLALAAGAVASPPSSPPPTRTTMPSPPIRPIYPPRPVYIPGVTVVPTTGIPRSYLTPAPILPVRTPYSVYYRYSAFGPWYLYRTYSSFWAAEAIGFELEYYLGVEAWVR